jgi:DNA recombination protein RmuC
VEFATLALTAVVAIIAVAALIFGLRSRGAQASDEGLAQMAQLAEKLADQQAQLAGRLSQIAEGQATGQARMAEQLQIQERAVTKMLDQRLVEVTRRVSEDLAKSSTKSTEVMGHLQERLAVIDAAQRNITELSAEVVTLQDILSNKQARGAIGQTQMEDLVRNMLPPGAFDFQFTLTNGKRADCVIKLPNPPGLIAVDSKYPHEAFMRLVAAKDDRERTLAEQQFKSDVGKHIKDIAEKYIVPGETADSAIMFVPAESVFAELHDRFPMIVEEGFRKRVYIVSPTTLMATLNTIRTILKDAKMREQAHVLQKEIGELVKDVARLDQRVGGLGTHFEQARKDIEQIQISTRKITDRGGKIENMQLDGDPKEPALRLVSEL